MMKRLLPKAALALTLLLSAGCETISYYGQAARGHWDVVSRQRPSEKIIQADNTDDELRRRLHLVEEARQFAAAHLGLKPGRHYTRYADLERDAVVYNVFAAPEFSLEPKRWWYPLIGRQSYRGFFGKNEAITYAKSLQAEGLDVYVGGIDAYSTLGWFRDPVLNTWIDDADEEIVALVFHELTHQLVYVADDTKFNEAYATAVEIAGVRLWLQGKNDPDALTRWDAKQTRREEFTQIVKTTRARLKALYQQTLPPKDMRQLKAAEITALQQQINELRERWQTPKAFASWTTKPVNNARLNTVSTYHDLVPSFLALLDQHHGDFPKFHAAVKRLGKRSKEQRGAILETLVASSN